MPIYQTGTDSGIGDLLAGSYIGGAADYFISVTAGIDSNKA